MAPVDAIARGETLAQQAYASLRHAIRDALLVHDRVYSESELAQSMGISRTPVREALIELSREGLVEILPQRGFRLRSLSATERAEVFGLRLALEGFVVERLAREASPENVAALRELIDRQRTETSRGAAEFLAIDEQFHLLMPQLLGLERTHRMLVTLRGAMWLMGSLALSIGERTPHVVDEHAAIVDAIEAHDPEAAVDRLRQHLSATAHAAEAEIAEAAARAADQAPAD
ncbi:MAG: GntR family transcriptional regulator [Thermoleophilaceae bacterium]